MRSVDQMYEQHAAAVRVELRHRLFASKMEVHEQMYDVSVMI
jgi:hypothetical protein